MRNQKKLNIGVIGCGNVAVNRHLPVLKRIANAEVVAVADKDPVRLNLAAERFRIKGRHSDYLSLVHDGVVDAVASCVPTRDHEEIAFAAMEKGKPLFVEKPVSTSIKSLEKMIKFKNLHSSKVMVGFNMRWHRLVLEAKHKIRAGIVGDVDLVEAVFTNGIRYKDNVPEWNRRREMGGGVLVEIAAHCFDLWRFILEDDIVQVFAQSKSPEWDDEYATLSARSEKGILLSAIFSERTTDRKEIHVYGSAGCLHAHLQRFDGLEFIPKDNLEGDLSFRIRSAIRTMREFPGALPFIRYGGDYLYSFKRQWEHFISEIRKGKDVKPSLEDALESAKTALAAIESSIAGRPIKTADTSP